MSCLVIKEYVSNVCCVVCTKASFIKYAKYMYKIPKFYVSSSTSQAHEHGIKLLRVVL